MNSKAEDKWSEQIKKEHFVSKTKRYQRRTKYGKNISRIWLEIPLNLLMNISLKYILNCNRCTKQGKFTQEGLNAVQTKIRCKEAPGLDEISREVWKTKNLDDLLFRLYDSVFKENKIERWTTGCFPPFPKKVDHGIAKKYRIVSLTSIVPEFYNALLRNRIEGGIKKIPRRNQNTFRRNWFTSHILTIRWISERISKKKSRGNITVWNFCKGFDSIHLGKKRRILFAYGLPR